MKEIKLIARGKKHLAALFSFTLLNLILIAGLVVAPVSAQSGPSDPQSPAVNWTLERVDAPYLFYDMTDRSLRLDAKGDPHIAYGGDHLYYSYYNSTTGNWTHTVVDDAFGVGSYASLALSKFGNPLISYYDAINGRLKFAQFDGANWTIQVVDEAAVLLQGSDPQQVDQPWRLEDPRTWRAPELAANLPEAVDVVRGVGKYSSIAVDTFGAPHISYYDEANGNLLYASLTASGWQVEVVENRDDVGSYSSLAIDSSNVPHISYLAETIDSLKYAYQEDPGVWAIETVDVGLTGAYTSISLDNRGNPSISYYDFGDGDLMYAERDEFGDWSTELIDSSDDIGLYTSIDLDTKNHPYISYYNLSTGALKYAYYTGTRWAKDTIESAGDVGLYTSLALDEARDGDIVIHVSYYDAGQSALKHASLAPGGSAKITVVRQGRDVGVESSLAIDAADVPHIVYLNDSTDDLKYATKPAGSWVIQEVQTDLSVGLYSDLTIDKVQRPSAAYYDATNGDLRYGVATGGVWAYGKVDETGNVGLYPRLPSTA